MQSTAVSRAIEDSIKGGFTMDGVVPQHEPFNSATQSGWMLHLPPTQGLNLSRALGLHETFLSKAFWVALGKARGWQEEWADKKLVAMLEERWLYEWHRFIDHLATGGDAESFFASLV